MIKELKIKRSETVHKPVKGNKKDSANKIPAEGFGYGSDFVFVWDGTSYEAIEIEKDS